MKDMIWAYLIHLGSNLWGDPGGTLTSNPYHDHLVTEDRTWRAVIDFLPDQGINTVVIDVADGIQYETHPELAIKGAWSKDKVRAELDYIRSLGMTPIPKLNFSACHDTWLGKYSYMVSTPEYYQVCKNVITEVHELFGQPKYFHLGMDEENLSCQKRYAYCVIRQGDLWWHDAYFFFDVCEKLGTRPWVWADYAWNHEEEYFRRMPRSVLQSNWYYRTTKRNPDGTFVWPRFYFYEKLDKEGFDQVPTGSAIKARYCNLNTMELCKEVVAPERLKGFMTAPWAYTTWDERYSLFNDAVRFGNARRDIFPETLK